ncbi:Serine/threonine-protein kinase plk2 [Mortierella hygrophila]|uniref:Serine/threonine-protein kinase plk2 n=1 Tax=Mortierella hygrophila TaxID=979708 RepID=A0A9P6F011_9FUNG|nr:Serine/threonine-protein kinase plk2 [Mortierella hygrophila]
MNSDNEQHNDSTLPNPHSPHSPHSPLTDPPFPVPNPSLSPLPLVNPYYLPDSYSPLACMDSNSTYCPEDFGSDANENDTPVVNDRPAPSPEKVPSGLVFCDVATGHLYVDVRGRPIAEGSFGAVHEVSDSKGERMALKVPKPTARMDMIRKEAQFMGRLRGHDNVATLHGVVEDKRGPCLLMPLYQPRDFYVLLINRAPLPVAEIKFYGKQLVAGLSFILEAGIRHCDLKPENVLVAEGMQLKISDFGLSEESSVKSTRIAGTPGYWAPEVMKGMVHTDKIDIFSVGIIFYMMFAREVPNITTENVVVYPPDNYLDGVAPSEDAKDLLDRTLKIDAEHRISVHQLANHKFLRQGFCPKSLPDTVFDEAPVFDNNAVEKHVRTSENNGEGLGAWKRKKRRAEKAAKGKEVVRWCRVETKSKTEAITDVNASADADATATAKVHGTRTGDQGETGKTTRMATLGAKAYHRYVAKEAVKEREWAVLLAQVQAQVEKERRVLHVERDALRDLFGGEFRDDGNGSQDGKHSEDDNDENGSQDGNHSDDDDNGVLDKVDYGFTAQDSKCTWKRVQVEQVALLLLCEYV